MLYFKEMPESKPRFKQQVQRKWMYLDTVTLPVSSDAPPVQGLCLASNQLSTSGLSTPLNNTPKSTFFWTWTFSYLLQFLAEVIQQ